MREIRENEKTFITFLLRQAGLDPSKYQISHSVDEYEGGKMGSIGMGKADAVYDGDIIRVEYLDSDHVPVVITLTKDKEGKLLDLDFWKTDNSKLITYPDPEKVHIKNI